MYRPDLPYFFFFFFFVSSLFGKEEGTLRKMKGGHLGGYCDSDGQGRLDAVCRPGGDTGLVQV